MPNQQFIMFKTLARKEAIRFFRFWIQSLIPPVITTSLYFLIFGTIIGGYVNGSGKAGEWFHNFSYIQFIVPGLILMSIITNSYMNTVSSFFLGKFNRSLEELQVSPTPEFTIICGYMVGGVSRGFVVGGLVTIVGMCFSGIHIQHYGVVFLTFLLTSMIFSLGGIINAIFARKFDDISIVPTFILTPLTYLGGVFYSVKQLPEFWQTVTHFNPITSLINLFRYGVLGDKLSLVGDKSQLAYVNHYLLVNFAVLFGCLAVVFGVCYYLVKKGVGIRA